MNMVTGLLVETPCFLDTSPSFYISRHMCTLHHPCLCEPCICWTVLHCQQKAAAFKAQEDRKWSENSQLVFSQCHIKTHVITYTVGEKLAGEKVALGLRPRAGLVSGVCSSYLPHLFCNNNTHFYLMARHSQSMNTLCLPTET